MNAPAAVDLCGQAMALLGVEPIAGFDEGTPAADACARLYEPLARQLLAAHPWNFAQRTAQLAKRIDAPDGWAAAFQPPADLLHLRGLWPTASLQGRPAARFDWHDGVLVADLDAAWCLYLARVDETLWPDSFKALLRYALAGELAMPLTERAELVERWERRAYGTPSEAGRGGQFRAAATADAQAQPAVRIRHDPLTDARMGGWGAWS